MAEQRVERRLTAILAADVAGYSRLMGADEEGTLSRLNTHRREFLEPAIAEHRGRIVKRTGDGILIEFGSAVDAVRCAIEIQRGMSERNSDVPIDKRIELRIGINVGDIIIEDDDIYGDGVNIAARLEAIAQPGGVCLSDDAYRQVRGRLDANFQDAGEQELKNIARPVRVYRLQSGVFATEIAKALPDKPSIAVMPFQNMSGDPEQDYFADGVAEDIITALSRFHWFFVIARNSSFSYKGTSPDIRQVAQELGVQYVLEGSVRKSGNRVRVTAQCIDGANGRHIWADRYDREVIEILTLQDEIAETVAGTIEPELSRAEQERALRKTSENIDAWDLYKRGLWHLWRFDKANNLQARDFLKRAVKIDASFTHAFSALAICHMEALYFGYSEKPPEDLASAVAAAEQAISLDDGNAVAYTARGSANLFKRNHYAALEDLQRAIALNPSYAPAYMRLGLTLNWMKRPEEAIPILNVAQRLSPRDPFLTLVWAGQAAARLILGEFEDAVTWGRKSVQAPSANIWSYFMYAAALGQSGHFSEGREAVQQLLRIKPDFSLQYFISMFPTNIDEVRDVIVEGLRKSGLET